MAWKLGISRETLETNLRNHVEHRLRQLGYVEHYRDLAAWHEMRGDTKLAHFANESANICAKHAQAHTERIRETHALIYRAEGGR